MLKEPKSLVSQELVFPDGAVGSVTGNEAAIAVPQKLGEGDK